MKIGYKIKDLRLKYGLTQEELAHRTELTKGYISQIERDITSPSISTLVDILSCLGTALDKFFSDDKSEQIVFTEHDSCTKEFDEYGASIRWLVSNAQKNLLEPILVVLQPDGHLCSHDPHEGEEFGYVIAGSIRLTVGDKSVLVKKGEAFCFKPDKEHNIQNTSKKVSKIIWVAHPPSF